MKPGGVLFLTVVYLALMHGIACAASFDSAAHGPSSQATASAGSDHSRGSAHSDSGDGANQRADGKSSGERDHNQASGAVHSRGKVTTATVPKQPTRDPKLATRARSEMARPADSSGSTGAQKGALMRGETVSKALPVRPPTVAHTGQAHNNVQHHSPNPAVVGGPASSKVVNTRAISGTGVHRKP